MRMRVLIKALKDFHDDETIELDPGIRKTLLSIGFIERVKLEHLKDKGDIGDVWRRAQRAALAVDRLTILARQEITSRGVKKALYHALGKKTWGQCWESASWTMVGTLIVTLIGTLVGTLIASYYININP